MFNFANSEEIVGAFSEEDIWVIRAAMNRFRAETIDHKDIAESKGMDFAVKDCENRIDQINSIIAKCEIVIEQNVDERFSNNNS